MLLQQAPAASPSSERGNEVEGQAGRETPVTLPRDRALPQRPIRPSHSQAAGQPSLWGLGTEEAAFPGQRSPHLSPHTRGTLAWLWPISADGTQMLLGFVLLKSMFLVHSQGFPRDASPHMVLPGAARGPCR